MQLQVKNKSERDNAVFFLDSAVDWDLSLSVNLQEQKFCQRYDQLMEAWEKKVERIENNPRRRAKESKVREYYEKQFPEIRKQRELQERMQRWDNVIKSTDNSINALFVEQFYYFATQGAHCYMCSSEKQWLCTFTFAVVLDSEVEDWPHLQPAVNMKCLKSLMDYQSMR